LRSQIKIVKRKQDSPQTDSQADGATKPLELSTREISIVVKKWISEMKDRKSQSQQYLTPLKVR